MTLDVVGGVDRVGHVNSPGSAGWRSAAPTCRSARGTRVLITGVQGTTLIVWPVGGELPAYLEVDEGDGPRPLGGEQEPS